MGRGDTEIWTRWRISSLISSLDEKIKKKLTLLTKKPPIASYFLLNALLLIFTSSPANAGCGKSWYDANGTRYQTCKWGRETENHAWYGNGTHTKRVCAKFGRTTTCTDYTNQLKVGVQECTNFSSSTQCNYKDAFGRTYKQCDYWKSTGWTCRDFQGQGFGQGFGQ